ncbi:MAG TPA: DUF6186 family protein [Jatrophihabitantaceae bacterium]|nr:DUF6186 family protein [Jatrophihabitantaceae bacterium]
MAGSAVTMIGAAAILGGYAVLAVCAAVLLVRACGRPGATPAAYLTTVMHHPVGRWVLLLLWMWVGWHFFVR